MKKQCALIPIGKRLTKKLKGKNKSLIYLNLWRCGVASEGGNQLAAGMANNDTVIFLELGRNGLTQSQEKRIAEKLDNNKFRYENARQVTEAA